MSGSPPPPPSGPIEYVDTQDHARIAIKRKPRTGARPAIFVHGLAVNADLWDIPPVDSPDDTFRSLPALLHEAGYDIWLVNLRGHGAPNMLSEPPSGQTDWCVDHFAIYDLPAVIEHVCSATGIKPFVIGNSMGAMTTAACLQGARLDGGGADVHIIADADVAKQRQESICGAVFVEFPAALRWPQSLYDEAGKLKWTDLFRQGGRDDADANFPFEVLSRMGWLQAILQATGEVSLEWMRPDSKLARWLKSAPKPIGDTFEWIQETVVKGATLSTARSFAERFKGVARFCPQTFMNGVLPAVDHMKAGVLKQMASSVRAGAFVSGIGEPPHVYSDHYELIECPALVLTGGRDRIANAQVTREVFFDRVRSADKTLHEFPEIAHGEFEHGPIAYEQVYPVVMRWVTERDKAGA